MFRYKKSSSGGYYMDWEFTILNFIRWNWRSDFLDKLMPIISFLGKGGLIWILLSVVCLFIKKARPFYRSLVCCLVFNLVACNCIIKPIVNRIRPCVMNTTVELLSSVPFDASFPSGHTLFAFAAATTIFIYNKWYGLAAYLFAFVMGFSRLYLYVHFPTDVLMGAIFGVIFAIAAYKVENMLFEKGKPIFRLKARQPKAEQK